MDCEKSPVQVPLRLSVKKKKKMKASLFDYSCHMSYTDISFPWFLTRVDHLLILWFLNINLYDDDGWDFSYSYRDGYRGGSVGNMKNICESLNWITARSVDRINWMMVGVCSPSIRDERGIFTCSIPTSNEWDIQV